MAGVKKPPGRQRPGVFLRIFQALFALVLLAGALFVAQVGSSLSLRLIQVHPSLKSAPTSQFRDEYRAQVAVNGDFFSPWHSRTPLDYYPHVGDPVQVQGLATSQGHIYSSTTSRSPVLVISKDNSAEIFDTAQSALKNVGPGKIENAISGNALLVRGGKVLPAPDWYRDQTDLHPRVAIGLDKKKQA